VLRFRFHEQQQRRAVPNRRLRLLDRATGSSCQGHTVAQDPNDDETPENTGALKYRYRDSKPASEE